MIMLGIRTDRPQAELYIYDADVCKAEYTWQADRELARGLLAHIEDFLAQNNLAFQDLAGLFVFQGPGSFTGLRIGLTVANTMAYSLGIPIVGASEDSWRENAVHRLIDGDNDRIVLPLYGAAPRITQPRK